MSRSDVCRLGKIVIGGLIGLIAFIGVIGVCSDIDTEPASCPTLIKEGTFNVEDSLERDIDDAIKAELDDPDTYERYGTHSDSGWLNEREDGTEYFDLLYVDFRAKNKFGGRQRATAVIELDESPVDGCIIEHVTIAKVGSRY